MPWTMKLIGEKVFLTDSFQFFINVVESLINERNKSKEANKIKNYF